MYEADNFLGLQTELLGICGRTCQSVSRIAVLAPQTVQDISVRLSDTLSTMASWATVAGVSFIVVVAAAAAFFAFAAHSKDGKPASSVEMEDLTMPVLEGHLMSLRTLKNALAL